MKDENLKALFDAIGPSPDPIPEFVLPEVRIMIAEQLRRKRLAEIAVEAGLRIELEARYGQVWSTEEMRQRFIPLGFLAPYVVVRDMQTGKKGSLEFQHSPRFYFNYQED